MADVTDLDPGERAWLRRLLDLEEVATLTARGHEVTTADLHARLCPDKHARTVERIASGVMAAARTLGFTVQRREQDDGRYVFEFDQELSEVVRVVGEKVGELTGDAGDGTPSYGMRRYHALLEAGVCVRCKSAPRPDRIMCSSCAGYWQDHYRRRVEAGLCTRCGKEPAAKGVRVGASCRRADKRARHDREREGLCTTCGQGPPAPDRKQCDRCLMTDYHSQRYRDLKALGLCRCKRPARPGKAMCQSCADKLKATNERRTEERRRNGLCLKCADPVLPGLVLCASHAEAQRLRSKAKTVRARAAGVCRECKAPSSRGKVLCETCAGELAAKKNAARAIPGVCHSCTKAPAVEGKRLCQECSDRRAARRLERIASGQCSVCPERAAVGRGMCERHLEQARVKARARHARAREVVHG